MLTRKIFSHQDNDHVRNRSKLSWLTRSLLGLASVLLIMSFLYGRAAIRRSNRDLSGCQGNLRQIALALAHYSQDNNEVHPLATVGGPRAMGWPAPYPQYKNTAYVGPPVGWVDALHPYTHSVAIYMCPSAPDAPTPQIRPNKTGYTDFWMNANLSGVAKQAVVFPSATLLVGEGNDGSDKTNATYNKTSLLPSCLTDSNSPAFRHMGGANYLFADGHVAWLRPKEVTNCYGRTNCFALK